MTFAIPTGASFGRRFEDETDVVVIGSGAGGAVATHALAEAGVRVVCLEEGAHVTRERFSGRQIEAMRSLYRHAGLTAAIGVPTIPIPTGCSIGGTTTINAGTSFRTPEPLVERWRREFGHAATPEEMHEHFDAIERVMPVAEVPPHLLGGNSETVKLGAARLGWAAGPIPRNAPTCHGCCRCVLGCPEDAKLSMNISFVPAGIARGARYFARMRVQRVEHRGGRATAVSGRLLDDRGARAGTFRIRCRAVVVACGAIHTPILLAESGLDRGSRHVGQNLRLHPAARAVGVFDRPVRGWKGVLQGYHVDQFVSEGVKIEGVFVPPGLLAAALPFFGARNFDVLSQYENMAVFGTMAQDESPGYVAGSVLGFPRVHYALGERDAARVTKGIWAIGKIFFAAGARAVYSGIFGFEHFATEDALDRLLEERVPPAALEVLSMHPHGTARMAATPRLGALDLAGKLYGTENVWVADASVFPSALGVNPQLSIMGYARRSALALARTLGRA
jgi:choline dehydrogenase-like flavoprotein